MLHFKLALNLVISEHYNLVHEGRVYNLKRTDIEDKQWVCRRVEKGCRGSIHTNLGVDAILHCNPHADDCIPDNDILYKMEKKTVLKRRAAEEMKTRHLGFYELLQLLIDEQGSTETLIQQVTSGRVTARDLQIKNKKYEELQQRITALTAEYNGGRVTARDLQIKNKKYEELQQRITALTAEYNGGTRTLEQFLRALAYLVPEGENY
ncbi:hypothetical protein T12_12453 [Trichinella patagoniensis]|uniref:FLYWCH-type domain-containing protein n=1 Tax=Trichinella patagoniensis TaxID=990121 RepID=A0A0V0ZET2_9BILA|nr:hypothetical protein T12_12453 [Trichinella patagoniensis]